MLFLYVVYFIIMGHLSFYQILCKSAASEKYMFLITSKTHSLLFESHTFLNKYISEFYIA